MTLVEALNTLGLAPAATPDEVKRAYRARIQATHPDLATDGDDAARRATEAVRVNAARDLLLAGGTGTPSQASPQPETPPAPPHSEPAQCSPTPGRDERRTTAATPTTPAARSTERVVHPLRWYLSIGGALIVAGAVARFLHAWDGALEPTKWGDASLAMGPLAILLHAAVGLVGVWFLGRRADRPARAVLALAVILYSSFSEVSHRLNFIEEAILLIVLVVWPLYRLVTR